MSIDNIITTLSEYSKYRGGRGRKYAEPDAPFDYDTVTEAIKSALSITRSVKKYMLSMEKM